MIRFSMTLYFCRLGLVSTFSGIMKSRKKSDITASVAFFQTSQYSHSALVAPTAGSCARECKGVKDTFDHNFAAAAVAAAVVVAAAAAKPEPSLLAHTYSSKPQHQPVLPSLSSSLSSMRSLCFLSLSHLVFCLVDSCLHVQPIRLLQNVLTLQHSHWYVASCCCLVCCCCCLSVSCC